MKRYAFLVRGINVGGRHKVVMEEFCRELEELLLVLERFLNKTYPFIKVFSLFTLEDYQNEVASLP